LFRLGLLMPLYFVWGQVVAAAERPVTRQLAVAELVVERHQPQFLSHRELHIRSLLVVVVAEG
jgi:hypothetical protein